MDKVRELYELRNRCIFFFEIGETWGTAFGDDGGRIIAAKVQVSRFVKENEFVEKYKYLILV